MTATLALAGSRLADFLAALRGLDVDDIGAWPRAAKAGCALAVAALIFVLTWNMWPANSAAALTAAERREAQLRLEHRKKQARASALPALQVAHASTRETFAALLGRLPERAEVPGLIEAITRAAIAGGLVLERIELGEEWHADQHWELPITLELRGGYHEFGAFAAAVAALPHLVTLHDFEIAATSEGVPLQLKIAAKTYRHLDATRESP